MFLGADILSIILLTLVYVNAEVNGAGVDSTLTNVSKVAGYLLVCFAEPLLIVSYTLRFLRIKRIFDAQQEYFDKGVLPKEMIHNYHEDLLAKYAVVIIGVFAVVYMGVGVSLWAANVADYGILPSYALSLNTTGDQANHMYVSLIFFVVTTLTEGFIFAYFLD